MGEHIFVEPPLAIRRQQITRKYKRNGNKSFLNILKYNIYVLRTLDFIQA